MTKPHPPAGASSDPKARAPHRKRLKAAVAKLGRPTASRHRETKVDVAAKRPRGHLGPSASASAAASTAAAPAAKSAKPPRKRPSPAKVVVALRRGGKETVVRRPAGEKRPGDPA